MYVYGLRSMNIIVKRFILIIIIMKQTRLVELGG